MYLGQFPFGQPPAVLLEIRLWYWPDIQRRRYARLVCPLHDESAEGGWGHPDRRMSTCSRGRRNKEGEQEGERESPCWPKINKSIPGETIRATLHISLTSWARSQANDEYALDKTTHSPTRSSNSPFIRLSSMMPPLRFMPAKLSSLRVCSRPLPLVSSEGADPGTGCRAERK